MISISNLNKQRVDLEQEVFNLKKLYNPKLSSEEIRKTLTLLTSRKNEILSNLENLKKKLENLENENKYKNFLEQIYYDIKTLDKSLEKTYKNIYSKLKINFQKKELFGKSSKIKFEDNSTEIYDQYKETKDLSDKANLKADSIISAGNGILGMFNKQNNSLKRIFGNLKNINSDAKFSDFTVNKILLRLKEDKKLVFGMSFFTLLIIVGLYYFLKLRA